MRILVVSPVGTAPMRSGAAQAVRGYCTALQSLGHEVHLVYHSMMSGDVEEMNSEWGERLHVIPYKHPAVAGSLAKKVGYRLRQWIKKKAYGQRDPRRYNYRLDEWYDESLGREVLSLHRRYHFGCILVNYVMLSRVFIDLRGETVVKVLVTHDRFTNRNFRVAGANTAAMWFSCSEEAEARALARADKIIALQDAERNDLQAISSKPVITISPWAQYQALPYESGAANTLLFIGSDITINRDGIMWFIDGVLPLLRKKNPLIQLKIAGRVCRLIDGEYPGVIKLGAVDHLGDAYAVAAIAINPVKIGTGLCIKSLEALSYGRPLVCEAVGARGLENAQGGGLLMAESAEDYVREIEKLTESHEFYKAQSRAGVEFVKTWNRAVMGKLDEIIK